jgi:hypothetical protein
MANKVVLKRSAVSGKTPTTSDLALGELALNTYDGNLFFKKDVSGTETIISVVTLDGTQTLTNKTLSAAKITGGLKDSNSNFGTSGQLLASNGSGGVQWVTRDVSTLDSLTDVTISSATSGQVLTYTGSQWINADSNAVIQSAVFATNAQTDLGYVWDGIIAASEDLGFIEDVAALIYDLGRLQLDGIVSLKNIDQSVKADYIGYSIIFGF